MTAGVQVYEAVRSVVAIEPAELTRVRDAGQRHVLEHYDTSGWAGDILRLCQGLLEPPSASREDILSS